MKYGHLIKEIHRLKEFFTKLLNTSSASDRIFKCRTHPPHKWLDFVRCMIKGYSLHRHQV